MNENRNIVWIAVIGVAVLILVAMLLFRPQGEGMSPSSPAEQNAPATGTRSSAFPNDPPLAPAVPVLPPEPTAAPSNVPDKVPGPGTTPGDAVLPGASPAPPEVPAPSGPTPAQPNIPPR